jgi:hypothetical protein
MQILSQYQQIHADTCTYLHSHGCPALQFASVARGWLGTPSHRSGCLNTGVLDLLGFRTVTTASAAAGTRAAAVQVGARAPWLHVHVRPRTWKLAVSVTVTVTAPGPSNDGPWRRPVTATRAKPAMLHLMNQSWPVTVSIVHWQPLSGRTEQRIKISLISTRSPHWMTAPGRAVGGAGLQSRAGLTTLENYNPLENYYPLEETIQLSFASMKWATMQQAGNFLPSFIWSRMDRLSMWSLDAFHLINYSSDWICPLESMLDCWSDDLPCWIFFEWTGTWAWYLES